MVSAYGPSVLTTSPPLLLARTVVTVAAGYRTATECRGGSGAELAVFDHLRGLVGVRPVDVGGVGEGEVLRHDDS